MVSSGNRGPFNRFRGNKRVSSVEKYIRARKRHILSPICLFGAPTSSEVDQFVAEQIDVDLVNSKRKLEKYDILGAPRNLLEDSDNEGQIGNASGEGVTFRSEVRRNQRRGILKDEMTSSSDFRKPVKFRPTIVIERSPLPAVNLFPSTYRTEPGTSSENMELGNAERYHASKRRRSSGGNFAPKPEKNASRGDSSPSGHDSPKSIAEGENAEQGNEKY